MAGSVFRVSGLIASGRPPKALGGGGLIGGGVACRGPGGGVKEVSSAAEAAVPADAIQVSLAAEAIKEAPLAVKSLAEVLAEAIEEVSSAAERIKEVSWEAEAVAAVPAEAIKETLSTVEAIEEASLAAVAGAAVPTEAIEEVSLASEEIEEASSTAKAIEEGSSVPKSLAEIRTAWIEKTSSTAEALEGVPAVVDLLSEVSTFEVWDPSTALEVCGSANPGGGGDFSLRVQVHVIACLPTGLQLLLNRSCKLSINSSCHKQVPPMAGSAFRVAGSRPPKALGGGVACRGPGGGVEEVSSATETAEEASSVAETIKEVLVEVIEEVSSTVETIEEVSSSAEAVAAVPADVIEVSSAAEAIKEVSLAAKSLAEVPTEAIEEVSWEAERIEEVSWEAEAVAAGPAEAMKETLSALQAIEEASSAAVAGTAVLTEAIEEASLVSEEASSMAKAIEEGSSAPKSLPEIWTAWIEKTSLAVEALEGGPAAVDLLPVVSTFEVWDPSTALEVCGSANPGGGDFAPPVQVHSIACLPTGLQLLLKNSCKLSINSSCDKQFPLVATNSPLSSAQNMTNELADGQRKFVLAEGSSKDLNNEAMQLSNGGMGCTEMLDKSHEQDSVPVRRVSRDLMKKIEALNMKTRRIAAQKVAAQVGCDEKGKCTEVANGKDSSSGITSYDAQSAKMKERARQRANELREEEEERKRTQKARAMAKLEELNMRWNNRDVPDQSKEQQVHHSYVKSSINRENWIDACDQRRRVYGSQLSETIFSQSRRGIDIDRRLPMFDARSSRMPSGKPSVGALPGSMPPRSSSRWIEKSYGEKAVGRTPRTRTAWVEKTMIGRSAPILPPQTTKTVWIEKRRDL